MVATRESGWLMIPWCNAVGGAAATRRLEAVAARVDSAGRDSAQLGEEVVGEGGRAQELGARDHEVERHRAAPGQAREAREVGALDVEVVDRPHRAREGVERRDRGAGEVEEAEVGAER